MFSFLQPSQMKNDQIYKLSLKPIYQRMNFIINSLIKIGKISKEQLDVLKEHLKNEKFLDDVSCPSLNYFIYGITTKMSDNTGINVTEDELIVSLQKPGVTEKFMSYFIVPCAKNEVEIEFSFSNCSLKIVDDKTGSQVLHTSNDYPNYTIITTKGKLLFFSENKLFQEIDLRNHFDLVLNDSMLLIKNNIQNGLDRIYFEFSDQLITKCIANNIGAINIKKSELSNNLIQNIDFTLNDNLYYRSCINLIKEVWIEYYLEIVGHIKLIAVLDTDAFGGFTTNLLSNTIFLSHHPNDFMWVTENIIHECAHSRLEQLLVVDPVVLNEPEERFPSPWRKDLRPMIGIFHGVFAFARIAMWLERLYTSIESTEILDRLVVVTEQLNKGIATIKENAKLSPIGEHVFKEILNYIEILNNYKEEKERLLALV